VLLCDVSVNVCCHSVVVKTLHLLCERQIVMLLKSCYVFSGIVLRILFFFLKFDICN